MNIVASYDSSASSAPSWFKDAVNAAISQMDALITNAITLNITFSWGEENNNAISAGCAGQNQSYGSYVDYTTLYNALASHATTADDQTAVATLTAANPLGSTTYYVPSAEQKALGLTKAASTSSDGFIGLASNLTWAYNADGSVTPGAYNPVACIEHEISEVLGRVAFLPSQSAGNHSVLDLYRYAAPGQHEQTQGAGSFSIDGQTMEQAFGNPGDAADWSPSVTGDAFGNLSTGTASTMTALDLQVMDVLGYTIGTPPGTAAPAASIPATSASAAPAPTTIHAGYDATLDASGGSDTFVFRPHPGEIFITAFAISGSQHDSLSFSDTSFSSLADVLAHTHQVGGNAVITIDAHDSITLLHTSAATLKNFRADFTFHG